MRSMVVAAGAAFVMAAVAAGSAAANEALFVGSGVFAPSVATLGEVEIPGDTFSFSFEVPSPLDGNPETTVTNFSYFVGGVQITDDPVANVGFYPAGLGGGANIQFSSSPSDVIVLYSADWASTGVVNFGTYDFSVDNDPINGGAGTVTISAIPEPATWAMMLVGFGGLGGLLRAGRKSRAAVTA
jgi:hypothetical protein